MFCVSPCNGVHVMQYDLFINCFIGRKNIFIVAKQFKSRESVRFHVGFLGREYRDKKEEI